jgi:hypothetical protein
VLPNLGEQVSRTTIMAEVMHPMIVDPSSPPSVEGFNVQELEDLVTPTSGKGGCLTASSNASAHIPRAKRTSVRVSSNPQVGHLV